MTVICKIMEYTTPSEAHDPLLPSNSLSLHFFSFTSRTTSTEAPILVLYFFFLMYMHNYNSVSSIVLQYFQTFSKSAIASHRGGDDGTTVYVSFQSPEGKKQFKGAKGIMSDSSHCQYEQSRCHSSNNTLYTDLFSPDK